ncbi:unnamed protein product [Mytilus edulis]|uniref:Uncharacterized protein n=1 Tax=Mytilus edulis TaxID=6550 RepID=A0A8S3VG45_MYTED|nr:unnamed protein product [Mytilus edulis]
MSKKFKQKELTGENIDETLAENITDLFRNGMDESQYNEMIKDELNPRPAKTDNETNEFSEVIDECNDVLALLGHTNRQINLARRDFIKYELNNEYTHLCAQSQPYTTFLFGDDVSKVAKDIEDCSKIANRIHFGRGSSRSRGRFGRGGRGRFGRGRGRGRGIGRDFYESHSRQDFASTSNDSGANNYPRRGGSRGFRKILRNLGYTNAGYIDDSLLCADTHKECKDNVQETISLMENLGFMIHPEKSDGAVLEQEKIGGQWTEKEREKHINYLEILAIKFAVQSFREKIKHNHVKVLTDNTTAVAYINNMGGSKSLDCNEISRSLWLLCIENGIWLSCTHIPGKLNTEADMIKLNGN